MPGGRNGGWHIEAALSEMSRRSSKSSRNSSSSSIAAVSGNARRGRVCGRGHDRSDHRNGFGDGGPGRACARRERAAAALSGSADATGSGASFLAALGAALNRVDSHIASASAAAKSFAAGGSDISLSDVMISLEEANLALQTAATVRDKVAAAYTTIMNMQV